MRLMRNTAALALAFGWIALIGASPANADTDTYCDPPVEVKFSPGEVFQRCKIFYSNGDYESIMIYCDARGNCEID